LNCDAVEIRLHFLTSCAIFVGNCIWYDEPQLLADVMRLLSKNNVVLAKIDGVKNQLPQDIEQIVKNQGYGDLKVGESSDLEIKKKVDKLRDQVRTIEATEAVLQGDYWDIQDAVTRASARYRVIGQK